jgi:hypothetical protein
MNKSSSKKALYFWLVIALLGATVVGLMFWSIRSNAAKTAALHLEIQNEIQINATLEAFQTSSKDSKDEQQKLTSYFLVKDRAVLFIEELESLAESQNVTAEIDTVNAITNVGTEREVLMVKLSYEGPWQRVMRMIDLIENMPYRIEVTEIDIHRNLGAITEEGATTTRSEIPWQGDLEITVAMKQQ